MALYDKASLVLIPSGTKEGTVFSQKPTNGDGDFTFVRASAATRVNSDGLIEKETQNLLLQSNTFDTTWNTASVSVAGGQSGYDGSSDAWLVTKTLAIAYVPIFQSISSSGVQTFSVYAKAGTLSLLGLYVLGGTNPFVSVNLSTGLVTGSRGGAEEISYNVEDVGSGWYRISYTYNVGITRVYLYPDWSQTNTGTIYIQDAQLEQGLVARDYIETTTAAVYGGITDNVPRLDYTDASCPSLLLEPQRTNLVIHSEYLEGLNQNSADLSLSSNLSPEGKYNAYRAEWVTGSQIGYAFAATNGETYTTSVYARSISGSGKIKITDYQGAETEFTITSEWARYELTATATQSAGRAYVRLKQSGDVVEFYGLQSELGSYATSYIPTYGSSVTRIDDVLTGNIQINNANNFSIYLEFDSLNKTDEGTGEAAIQFPSTTAGYWARIYPYYTNEALRWFLRGNGVSRNIYYGYDPASTKIKTLITYDGSAYKIYTNGSLIYTWNETAYTLHTGSNTAIMNIDIEGVLTFNRVLSNEEAIDLTTI